VTEVTTDEATDEADLVQRGKDAWERLKKESRDFDDWMRVGEALKIGRALASNNDAMTRWIDEHGFRDIDKSDRVKLLKVTEKRAEIEDWRANLTANKRLRLNHPATVWRNWPGSKKQSASAPNQAKPAKPKARPPGVSQKEKPSAELDEGIRQLKQELEELEDDIRVWLLGSSVEEMVKILAGMPPETLKDLRAAIDEVIEGKMPEPPKTPVSRLGDVWRLGAEVECPECGETTPVGRA
jgi:hypothetical protein